MSPTISVGIFKIKVLADIVEGNSKTNKQINLLAHLSISDPPTYLVGPMNKIKDASFVTVFWDPNSFYFSINRCHLVLKVCKYSPQFHRSSEVSRTKSNPFLPGKENGKKNFQKAILGVGLRGQDWVGQVVDFAGCSRHSGSGHGSGWSQSA